MGAWLLLAAVAACGSLLDIPDVREGMLDSAFEGGAEGGAPDGSDVVGVPDGRGDEGIDARVPNDASLAEGAADAPVTCGDTTSNPLHCGACGHSCLGGPCAGGKCGAFAVQPDLSSPFSIAVDATHIYWADQLGDVVQKGDKNGPGGIVTLASGSAAGAPRPFQLAIDETSVYWVNYDSDSGVYRCAKAGCANVATRIAASDYASSIAVDTANVYVGEEQSGNVFSADKLGTNVPRKMLAATGGQIRNVAVDATHVYWTNEYNSQSAGRRIGRAPKDNPTDGGTFETLLSNIGLPFDILVLGNDVYFTRQYNAVAVFKMPTSGVPDGGAPIALGSATHPAALVTDGVSLYWIDRGAEITKEENNQLWVYYPHGSIRSCALPDCASVRILATEQYAPYGLALDADAVYWTIAPDGAKPGAIWKMAK